MPRTGGESDKLGNHYEGIWTIGRLLELANGQFEALTVEPIGEWALGIEFVVRRADRTREFHSVKRQRSKGEWSLAALARQDKKTGRSILGDLCEKLSTDVRTKCWFVSSTGANDFRELAENAVRRKTFSDFQADLNSKNADRRRQSPFEYFLQITPNRETAYAYLQRMCVVLIDEATLTRHVDQHIAYLVYRPDKRSFSAVEVRVLLGDFILGHLGSEIRHDAVWKFLKEFGYRKRDWAADPTILDIVRRRNREYLRAVEIELINGTRVPRDEARTIVDELTGGDGTGNVLISAPAGVGKSCVIAQTVDALESRNVPVLVVRMDRHGKARSTRDIGDQMELPQSPSVVLAGLANGRDSVLVVDQLDAVSQVSGRYPHLWEVFDSLCDEAASYPNMRLVIACRDFDLQHDHRLRKLTQEELVKRIEVQLLSIDGVRAAIAATGRTDVRLTPQQQEILRIPLHLFLFLDGLGDVGTAVGFRNIGDLFDLYWERKQKKVSERLRHESAWSAVTSRLCEIMSRDLTVSVPEVTVDDWLDTVAAMLTEHVLIRDENQIRFFHESFFDYAFARRFFATGESLVSRLQSGEQHLFRRSQVRQILQFSRDHDRHRYLVQLRHLLADSGIRFHIRSLTLAWLGTLADPTSDEWDIVEPLLRDPDLRRHALPSIRNSLPWFDTLHELGVIARWLSSPDEEIIDRGLWFLMFDQVRKHRSEIAAALLAPYSRRSSEWTNRLRAYFRFGGAHNSRPIQKLFLQLLDDGVFEGTTPDRQNSWWSRLRDAGEHAPLFALEAITCWLDRRIDESSTALDESRFEPGNDDRFARQLIKEVASREPAAYIQEILPRVLTVINTSARPSENSLWLDDIRATRSSAEPMRVFDSLWDELVTALETLATESPDQLETITAELLKTDSYTDSHSVTYLLLRVWSANPLRFGSTCIRFMAADRRRLDVGYVSWCGEGDGDAAVSREAIQACLPHATAEEREQLEQSIVGVLLSGEAGAHEGWTERLLLEAFGEEHLSRTGRERLLDLRGKFPEQDIAIPPRRSPEVAQRVSSPIPPDEAERFTDDQWLTAMRQYNFGWDGWTRGLDREMNGSAVELGRVLQPQARRDRRRFAALTDRMDDSIRAEYYEAILDGMCGVENLSKEEREADDGEFRQLETDVVLGVIRRLHRLPNRPCGRSICRAFERLADRSIPDADWQILAYYALEDPDPTSDDWRERDSSGKQDRSESAYVHGYNSVRGRAARSIKALLFADYSRSTFLLPLIRQVVRDPSIAVRTCVVEALLPVLNHDWDEAVRLFLETCDGAEVVFGCHPFENFVRYASSTHYSEMRTILRAALQSPSDSAVAVAARQICLAAFADDLAEQDAEFVRTGTETMRSAAATVYSYNLGNATVSAICRQHLCRFFADESEKVRAAAADCFVYLTNADFKDYTDIIKTYVDSPAFPSRHDALLRRLEDSTWQLPEITIRLAGRFIDVCGTTAGDVSTAAAGDAPTVSKLIVRLYAQTARDAIKMKCLDLIDEMERLAIYGIDSQLAEHDR